ncbi:MAG: hypothetical protein RLZZ129_45 [Verrucomicrobiota bacterium]|jgi:hypothetical protein
MKTSVLSPRLIAATLFLATGLTAVAQDKPPRPDEARRASMLKQFDRDGDGKLSPAERATAREAMQKMRQGQRPGAKPPGGPGNPAFRHGYLLGKFDADGDGKLSETERAAAKAHVEQRMRTRMEKQLARLKTVDADGDGKISDAEWATAREKMQAWRQEHGPKAGKKQD